MAISTGADYIAQVQRNIADLESADFTQSQILGMVNEARQRVALDTHCYRRLITGLNTIPQQETYLYNGSLAGVQITNGGSNYPADPGGTIVSFTGGSGAGAAGDVVVDKNNVITGVNMTNWGSGYSPNSPPTINFTGSPGSGATATPIILYNVFDILSIAVLWGSLRLTFGWLPFTGFQAYCRAYTNQYSTPGVYTMFPGVQFKAFLYPIPDQIYPMEWDVITLPTDLAQTTTPETQIVAPWNDAVQFYATFLACSALQQMEKARFWFNQKDDGSIGGMYGGRIKQLPATYFSRRMPNPYRTYYPMIRKI